MSNAEQMTQHLDVKTAPLNDIEVERWNAFLQNDVEKLRAIYYEIGVRIADAAWDSPDAGRLIALRKGCLDDIRRLTGGTQGDV